MSSSAWTLAVPEKFVGQVAKLRGDWAIGANPERVGNPLQDDILPHYATI
jgi:hypothetical protein